MSGLHLDGLHLDGLQVDIRGASVVRSVGFDAPVGSITALVGGSGSGKTMCGLALLDLLPPGGRVTGGRATIDGRPIDLLGDGHGLARRSLRGRTIAMIFQEPMAALHPQRSIGAQLVETLRWHRPMGRRAAQHEAAALLERVGIDDASRRLGAFPFEFSGGMCQRVMIALALAGHPRVLFADEPTTALDTVVQRRVLDLLRACARDLELAIVLVSHDLAVVGDVADAVVVLDDGCSVESGTPASVFRTPTHPATQGLVAAADAWRVDVAATDAASVRRS